MYRAPIRDVKLVFDFCIKGKLENFKPINISLKNDHR